MTSQTDSPTENQTQTSQNKRKELQPLTAIVADKAMGNKGFTLEPVRDARQAKAFIQLAVTLYKGDKNWIRPLDKDINKIFDPKQNRLFRKGGELERWLLKDSAGKYVGRVAAFKSRDSFKDKDQPTGGMGFFECINDKEAAFTLFDACKNWLVERDLHAMEGPINFGEKNAWWGLLVDGFKPPVYQMNYHHPYYQALFEDYGFQMYYKQYSYAMLVFQDRPKKYFERAEVLAKDPDYTFEHVDKNNLEKAAEDFMAVWNGGWGKIPGSKPMTKPQCMKIMLAMKPIMVDYLLWFGYYKGEPIAMYHSIPELNQYFRFVNGKLNLIGKIKFLYHRWRNTGRKFFGVVFGVVKEQQGKGVEGAIIMAADKAIRATKKWDYIELTWIGDFNPKMMRVAENLGANIDKTHITYRLLFDPNAEFKRSKTVR